MAKYQPAKLEEADTSTQVDRSLHRQLNTSKVSGEKATPASKEVKGVVYPKRRRSIRQSAMTVSTSMFVPAVCGYQ
ncbi:hypothetical protein QC764_0033800 [Podospora pseudoanserina]|uniref:Uncharacterized protein n=1 Tax=Podospora pseudoanserina TaxID=2609844 RepID=A0ABR0IGQ9_9PEZI|nr:hypothetical protein QC764_0033800 [Podospora pseudoanserina]